MGSAAALLYGGPAYAPPNGQARGPATAQDQSFSSAHACQGQGSGA